jgi:hypothetical protein
MKIKHLLELDPGAANAQTAGQVVGGQISQTAARGTVPPTGQTPPQGQGPQTAPPMKAGTQTVVTVPGTTPNASANPAAVTTANTANNVARMQQLAGVNQTPTVGPAGNTATPPGQAPRVQAAAGTPQPTTAQVPQSNTNTANTAGQPTQPVTEQPDALRDIMKLARRR